MHSKHSNQSPAGAGGPVDCLVPPGRRRADMAPPRHALLLAISHCSPSPSPLPRPPCPVGVLPGPLAGPARKPTPPRASRPLRRPRRHLRLLAPIQGTQARGGPRHCRRPGANQPQPHAGLLSALGRLLAARLVHHRPQETRQARAASRSSQPPHRRRLCRRRPPWLTRARPCSRRRRRISPCCPPTSSPTPRPAGTGTGRPTSRM